MPLNLPFPDFVNNRVFDAEEVDANNAAIKAFVDKLEARPAVKHASTHAKGGEDVLTPVDIGALSGAGNIGSAGVQLASVVNGVVRIKQLQAGPGIDLAVAAGGQVTISATNSGAGGLTVEDVQDIVGAMVRAGANVLVAYDDAAGTLTISASGGGTTEPVSTLGSITNLQATAVNTTTADMGWTAPVGASLQWLQRAPDVGGLPGTFADIGAQLAGNATTARDATGVAGTKYHWRIRFTDGTTTKYSNSVSFTLPAETTSTTAPSTYRSTHLGNSLSSRDIVGTLGIPIDNSHIQHNLEDFVVVGDQLYPTAPYDEVGKQSQTFDLATGKLTGRDAQLMFGNHRGGDRLCYNDNHWFYAATLPFDQSTGFDPRLYVGFLRRRRSDFDASSAAFAGGTGPSGNFRALKEAHVTDGGTHTVSGMWATNTRLYVSRPWEQVVEIRDAAAPATLIASFAVPTPGPIRIDGAGKLWVISGNEVRRYTVTGDAAALDLTLTLANWKPRNLAIALGGVHVGRLIVTDDGPDQNFKVFNVDTLTIAQQDALGDVGGVFAGPTPGLMGPTRFYAPTQAGIDANGDWYTCCGRFTGADIRGFTAAKAVKWAPQFGVIFLDTAVGERGTAVTSMWTRNHRFGMDWSKPAGSEQTLAAYTIDRVGRPGDLRLHRAWGGLAAHSIVVLGGKRFMIMTDQNAIAFVGFKQVGEFWVQSFIFSTGGRRFWEAPQPGGELGTARWMWRDRNGDGAFTADEFETDSHQGQDTKGLHVDTNGDLWLCQAWQARDGTHSVWRLPFGGLDAHGNPIWTFANKVSYAVPAPLLDTARIYYDAARDWLWLSGFDGTEGTTHWGSAGNRLCRYDNFLAGGRVASKSIALPYDGARRDIIYSLGFAKDRIVAGGVSGFYDNGVKKSLMESFYIYDAVAGTFKYPLVPGSEIGGNSNTIDMYYGTILTDRSDGAYIMAGEDVVYAKTDLYFGMLA